MKNIASVLMVAACAQICRGAEVEVSDAAGLVRAVGHAQPGDHIVLADGEYRDVVLDVVKPGAAEAPITIAAANAGKAVVVGKTRLRFAYGADHWIVKGISFGRTAGGEKKTAALELSSSHVRISECSFFSDGVSRGETLVFLEILGGGMKAPRYIRVDHCSFVYTGAPPSVKRGVQLIRIETREKFPYDFEFTLDKFEDPEVLANLRTPCYIRFDHNYIAQAPHSGVTDIRHRNDPADIEFGLIAKILEVPLETFPADMRGPFFTSGALLFDSNLFEGGSIYEHSTENVYLNNTFLNRPGRIGMATHFMHNFWVGAERRNSGLVASGEGAYVGNYFQIGGSPESPAGGMRLLAGSEADPENFRQVDHHGGAHHLHDGVVANNVFDVIGEVESIFPSDPIRRRPLNSIRANKLDDNYRNPELYTMPTRNHISGNLVYKNGDVGQVSLFGRAYKQLFARNTWTNNFCNEVASGSLNEQKARAWDETDYGEERVSDRFDLALAGFKKIDSGALERDEHGLLKFEKLPVAAPVPNHVGFPVDMKAYANKQVKLLPPGERPYGARDFDLGDLGDTLPLSRPLGRKDVGPKWQDCGALLGQAGTVAATGSERRGRRRKKSLRGIPSPCEKAPISDQYLVKWFSGDLDAAEYFTHANLRWQVGRGPLDMKNAGIEGIIVHSVIYRRFQDAKTEEEKLRSARKLFEFRMSRTDLIKLVYDELSEEDQQKIIRHFCSMIEAYLAGEAVEGHPFLAPYRAGNASEPSRSAPSARRQRQ